MFLDYSSWSEHVSDASVVDFVSEFDKKMRTCMPADKGNKARFLQAVVKGREMTDMTGSVQCDGCSKWRKFPASVPAVEAKWRCSLNA